MSVHWSRREVSIGAVGAAAVGIEILEPERQLIRGELLGAAPELGALQLLDDEPGLFDLPVAAFDRASRSRRMMDSTARRRFDESHRVRDDVGYPRIDHLAMIVIGNALHKCAARPRLRIERIGTLLHVIKLQQNTSGICGNN